MEYMFWYVFLGKIKELFGKEVIDNLIVLVLVNVVYFKVKWEREFNFENIVDVFFCFNEVFIVLVVIF